MSDNNQNLSDTDIIKALRSEYDLKNDDDVLRLYAVLQSGQIVFHTQEGRDFDDLIYEQVCTIRGRQAKGNKSEKKKKTQTTKEKSSKKDKKVVVLTRKQYQIRKLTSFFLAGTAVLCFLYFGYYCVEAYQKDQESRRLAKMKENSEANGIFADEVIEETDAETGEKKYYKILDEYKSLYNINKNLIGWLKIDDTIIDYPVLQSSDNEYYLEHDINQQYDKNGTLFMDSSCNIRDRSTNLIIYGHNMRSGKMFGSLVDYKSEAFYKKHKQIQFDTIYEKGIYEVMFVFNSHVYEEDEVTFKYYQFIDANSEMEFDSDMKEMDALSLYSTGVTASYGDELLTLSTCDYDETNGRFVVVAKRIQ